MRKYIGNVIQGIAGFGVMLLLWCIGAMSYYYSFTNFEIYLNSIFYYLPNIVIIAMPVLLLVFVFNTNALKMNSVCVKINQETELYPLRVIYLQKI